MTPSAQRSGSIAVTGATGFLGSRIIAELADRSPAALVRAPVTWLDDARQVEVDLLDPVERVAEALAGVDTVIHLAGHNEVVAAAEPDRALTETVLAGHRLVRAAARAGVGRIVYVSTVHVYGAQLVGAAVIDEEVPPAPRSIYAIARLAVEHLVAATPDAVVLRLTNAVGAPVHPDVNRWTLVAADLCRTATSTGAVVLQSSGQQWRDFIALDDVARIVVAATDPEAVPAGTYNVASGRAITVRALAELVQDRVEASTGSRPVLQAPAPTGPDPAPYRVDPGRLAARGLVAEVPISDAIDDIIALCLAHPTTTGALPT
ncbi:MAG: SDR family oxidoreductase [Actinomycetota bacterium]|nr:SDR family oxidoreductase [Actinomycetota bacterium]